MKVGFPYLTKKGKLTIAFADEVEASQASAAAMVVTAVLKSYPGGPQYQPRWVLLFGDAPNSTPFAHPFEVSGAIVYPGDSIHLSIRFAYPWDRMP